MTSLNRVPDDGKLSKGRYPSSRSPTIRRWRRSSRRARRRPGRAGRTGGPARRRTRSADRKPLGGGSPPRRSGRRGAVRRGRRSQTRRRTATPPGCSDQSQGTRTPRCRRTCGHERGFPFPTRRTVRRPRRSRPCSPCLRRTSTVQICTLFRVIIALDRFDFFCNLDSIH